MHTNFELLASIACVALGLSASASASFIRTADDTKEPLPVMVGGSASTYAHCGYYLDFSNKQCGERFLKDAPRGKPTAGDCRSAAANYSYSCIQAIDTKQIPFPFVFQYPNTTETSSATAGPSVTATLSATEIPQVQNRDAEAPKTEDATVTSDASTSTADAATSTADAPSSTADAPSSTADASTSTTAPASTSTAVPSTGTIITATYAGIAWNNATCRAQMDEATKTCARFFKDDSADRKGCFKTLAPMWQDCVKYARNDAKFGFVLRYPPHLPNVKTPGDYSNYIVVSDMADNYSFCEPLGAMAERRCHNHTYKRGTNKDECLNNAKILTTNCKTMMMKTNSAEPLLFLFTYPKVVTSPGKKSSQAGCNSAMAASINWCRYELTGKAADVCVARSEAYAKTCSQAVASEGNFDWKFNPFPTSA
ncbi:hypothetical protein HDU96_009578 [Phlyctochytrium bullatum]|nr:hypothetical protein HDU96_009578 [Phlyctochytrium bullatum]